MSLYSDFLYDLPKRTIKLLDRHYFEEKNIYKDSYEVTLLISLSMPLFTTSVELIKKDGDNTKNENDLKTKINSAKENLLRNISENWECGNVQNDFKLQDFELNIIKSKGSVGKSKKEIFTLLKEIRNGLSHAGVRFLKGENNDIRLILFRSRISMDNPDKGYNIQIIPVDDYKQLIENLCKLLISQKMSLFDLSNLFENEFLMQKTGTDD
jgi:hypothetical protein